MPAAASVFAIRKFFAITTVFLTTRQLGSLVFRRYGPKQHPARLGSLSSKDTPLRNRTGVLTATAIPLSESKECVKADHWRCICSNCSNIYQHQPSRRDKTCWIEDVSRCIRLPLLDEQCSLERQNAACAEEVCNTGCDAKLSSFGKR